MRIGIDARFLSESGVGRYIRNLLYFLQKLDSKNEYFILLRKKDFEEVNFSSKNFNKVLADIPWYGVAEQIQLPKLLYSLNLDLVHFPHFNIPVFYRGKFVVTIHDLIHQKFKMNRATTLNPFVYAIKHHAYNFAFATALKKSEKIITVSNYVENELIKDWKVDPKKIVVTKEGVEDTLIQKAKLKKQKDVDEVLKKFGVKPPFTAKQEPAGFIFYVGNAHPHKNVEGLIKAFLRIKSDVKQNTPTLTLPLQAEGGKHVVALDSLKLVLAGKDHYFWQRIREEYRQRDIIYTGFVTDEELVALYRSAKVYVVPSFEEGFGIPLLEAMSLGTPVVASNTSATPEVGGDAAVYFDPKDPNDIAEKIMTVLNSEKVRKELIEKGEKRVKEFSWKKMAEQTLKVYNSN